MKNFFKKLALVLALALVVTVVAPAAASKSEAASVALNATKKTIGVGSSYDFNIKNKVKGSTYKWTSDNTKVAAVNAKNGVVTAKAAGTAKVSVKITLPNKTTKTLTATVTVKKYVDATAVAIKNPVSEIKLGTSHDFNRTMTPATANNKTYWVVKDAAGKEVANTKTGVGADIMTSAGVFKPATAGEYTITAECWRSKTATVKRAESDALKVSVVDDIAAKAVGAKKVEVTFGAAVANTKNVTFEVKKGTTKVNVSSVEWDSANKVATLTMAGNLTDADYTVTVTGVNTNAMTASFKATAPKVTEIKIISDKAIMTDVLTTGKGKVTAAYKVYNQYGEDVTKTTDVVITSNGGTNTATTKGQYKSTNQDFDTVMNKTLVLSIVHTATGANANASLPVVSKAVASSVEIVGLYNKDNKELVEGTTDTFYLEVKVKDQYGNDVDAAAAKNDLLISQTNTTVATISSTNSTPNIVKIPNTKDRYGIQITPISKAGSTTVLLVSKYNGSQASFVVNVAESTRAYNVTLDAPEFAVAAEDILVPVTVTDKDGNVITNLKTLKDNATNGKGIKVAASSGNASVIVKDGATYIKIAGITAETYVTLTATAMTSYKVASINFKVGKAARPVAIVGLDSKYATASVAPTATLKLENIVFEDQYGRKVTSETANFAAMFGTTNGDVKVTVVVDDTTILASSATTGLTAASDTTTLTKVAAGTSKITLGLAKKNDSTYETISGSEYAFNFRFASSSEYKSYKVADLSKMFDEVGAGLANSAMYDQQVKVYGVLDDGKEIALSPNEYTVSAPSFMGYSAGKLQLNAAAKYADEKATDCTAKVVVTINATGEQFEKEVAISKVKPVASEIKVVARGTSATTKTAYNNAKALEEAAVNAATTFYMNARADILVVDSYGVVHTLTSGATDGYVAEAKYTVVPADGATYKLTIAGNNTNGATVTNMADGLSATVTVTIDGASASFKLVYSAS